MEERSAKVRRTILQINPGTGIPFLFQIPMELLPGILAGAWTWELGPEMVRTCRIFRRIIMTAEFFAIIPPPPLGFPNFWSMSLMAATGRKMQRQVFEATLSRFEFFRPSPKKTLKRTDIFLHTPLIDNPTKKWVYAYFVCLREINSNIPEDGWKPLKFSGMAKDNDRVSLARRLLLTEPGAWDFGRNIIRIDEPSTIAKEPWFPQLAEVIMRHLYYNADCAEFESGYNLLDDENDNSYGQNREIAKYIPLIWNLVGDDLMKSFVDWWLGGEVLDAVTCIVMSGPVTYVNDRGKTVFLPKRALKMLLGKSKNLHLHYWKFCKWISQCERPQREDLLQKYIGAIFDLLGEDKETTSRCEEILLKYDGVIDITGVFRPYSDRVSYNKLKFVSLNLDRPGFRATYSPEAALAITSDGYHLKEIITSLRRKAIYDICRILKKYPKTAPFWAPLFKEFLPDMLAQIQTDRFPTRASCKCSQSEWGTLLGMLPLIKPLDWQKVEENLECQRCRGELKALM